MNRKARYTLIEIIVTLAIIAILAGISLGVTSYIGNKNKETQTKAALQLIRMALENYKQEFGTYPWAQTDDGIAAPYFKLPVITNNSNTTKKENIWACFKDVQLNDSGLPVGIRGLKMKKNGVYFYVLDGWGHEGDDWGHEIIYLYPGVFNQSGYDLGSVGPDGKFGDAGGFTSPGKRSEKDDNYRKHFGTVDDITNFTR